MPSDIRSFFGGQAAASPAQKAGDAAEKAKKRGRARKVVDDDDDDDDAAPVGKLRVTPSKKEKKRGTAPSLEPDGEETTASAYFGKGTKPSRSEAARPKTRGKPPADEEESEKKPNGTKATPKKNGTSKGTASTRSSARKTKSTSYVDVDENDFPDDDLDEGEDNARADMKTGRRMGDDYREASDEEDDDVPLRPKKATAANGRQKKLGNGDDESEEGVDVKAADGDFVVPDADEGIVEDRPKKGGRKRKTPELEEEDDLEVEEVKPKKKRATPAKKNTPAKKKKEEPQDSAEVRGILDNIPTIRAPSPPPKNGDGGGKPKFQFGQHANSAVPAGAMSYNDIPHGADNCLAGLTFVFTGQLEQLGREQGQSLVKQYGGKVTTAPSKKTSYVVLGADAGPKKLETIKQYGLKVINEAGLFALIERLPANGGDSAAGAKAEEQREKDEQKIREAAAEMEKEERARAAAAKPKPNAQSASKSTTQDTGSQDNGKQAAQGPDTRLWTVRYAPTQLTQICGNKIQVERLQRWLRAFPKNQRTKFKMPGPDGSGIFRAIMIHGPPGIGKTTAAHLVAQLEGYDVVESNASDTRSKKLVETGLKGVLSTTSLMGYFGGPGSKEAEASKKKLVLIMDEVDGMSAGDRGGVGALATVAKTTQIPMILICNDRKQPKMKPFDFVTFDLPFRRPTTDQIRSRISTIAYREGLKMPANVINALIEGTGADIRQVVNMISTAKLDAKNLSFEDSKDMSKAWEKHIVLKPWDMVNKILGGGLFNPAVKSSLNEKQELYFNDHEFAPLMLQENYLGTSPARLNPFNAEPTKKRLAALQLASKAADTISDGDLVDRMIHGSQQHWSLMPLHAIFSFVRPASFVYGSLAGHQTRFTSWLGKNSNQGKLMRIVKEIQGHMRLKTSADRHEIRQTYQPILFERLVRRLQRDGKEAVPEIIEMMDEYFLTKEDWDGILELGVGENDQEKIKIESQSKASFTRQYNQQSHPLPFMKASSVLASKRAPAKEKPDLEEALEESAEEDNVADADAAEEDEDVDLSKDKYVKQPKKKKTAAGGGAKGKGTGNKRKKADVGDDDDEEKEEEDVKPKKARGKGKAKK